MRGSIRINRCVDGKRDSEYLGHTGQADVQTDDHL